MDESSNLPQPVKRPTSSVAKDPRSPANEISNPAFSEGVLDRLLDRYITVWVWSVLFGASTGLVFYLISYRTDSRWGPFNALLLIIFLVSLVASLMTLRALLRCMSVYLIPKFILHRFSESGSSTSDKDAEPQQSLASKEIEAESKAAEALRRAFEYLVIGAAARIAMTVIEMIFASLQPGSF